jgi:signal transduction histidine kinase
MSHGPRTPLNAIIGFGQLLELDELTETQRESRLPPRSGRHLLELINEVLDIAGIESGRLTISPEAVALAEVLREAVCCSPRSRTSDRSRWIST